MIQRTPLLLRRLAVLGAMSLIPAVVNSASAQIGTNASADLVLGQTDFTSSSSGGTASQFNNPTSVAIDPTTGKVFVADPANNRVLRYPSVSSLVNGASAEKAFGQTSLAAGSPNGGNGATPTGSGFSLPQSVSIDPNGTLWVTDSLNNRVLGFENAATTNDNPAFANTVLGQADFVSRVVADGPNGMSLPLGVSAVALNRLVVGDTLNNRVLVFNSPSTLADGAAASRVLGQPNFTTTTSGTTINKLDGPRGVMVFTGINIFGAPFNNIYVADTDNNRVLRWQDNAFSTSGDDAVSVLGQTNFTSNGVGTGPAGMTTPTGVFRDEFNSTWVTDVGNNRILRFDGSDVAASAAVGQLFLSGTSSGIAANRLDLSATESFVEDNGNLWVADSGNNRVLRFSRPVVPGPTPTPTPTVTDTARPDLRIRGRKSVETLRKRVVIRGSVSDDVSGVAGVNVKARGAKVVKSKVKVNGTFKVVLRLTKDDGRIVVKLNAVDNTGKSSKKARFRILRR